MNLKSNPFKLLLWKKKDSTINYSVVLVDITVAMCIGWTKATLSTKFRYVTETNDKLSAHKR